MNCNCANWDDEKPCPVHHPVKLVQPELVQHQVMMVRLYRRRSNRKWFYTITVDAVRTFLSDDFNTKPKLTSVITSSPPSKG